MPANSTDEHSPLMALLTWLLIYMRYLFPTQWYRLFRGQRICFNQIPMNYRAVLMLQSDGSAIAFTDYLVVIRLIVLVAVVRSLDNNLEWLFVLGSILSVYWYIEIMTHMIGIPLLRVSNPVFKLSPRRDVLLGFLNIVQVTLIFAILADAMNRWAPVAFKDDQGHPLKYAFAFVYMSWTNLLTLGNAVTAATWYAKALTMAEVMSGLFLIAIAIGILVGAFRLRTGEEDSPAPAPEPAPAAATAPAPGPKPATMLCDDGRWYSADGRWILSQDGRTWVPR